MYKRQNESFAEFADTLQKEIENETGIKFGILGLELFNGMIFEETTTEEKSLTENQTAILLSHLADKGFIKAESSMSKDCLLYTSDDICHPIYRGGICHRL